MRDYYCAVVLRYDRRWNLDGEETAETVDEFARIWQRKGWRFWPNAEKPDKPSRKKPPTGGM